MKNITYFILSSVLIALLSESALGQSVVYNCAYSTTHEYDVKTSEAKLIARNIEKRDEYFSVEVSHAQDSEMLLSFRFAQSYMDNVQQPEGDRVSVLKVSLGSDGEVSQIERLKSSLNFKNIEEAFLSLITPHIDSHAEDIQYFYNGLRCDVIKTNASTKYLSVDLGVVLYGEMTSSRKSDRGVIESYLEVFTSEGNLEQFAAWKLKDNPPNAH
ncbi:hypothetical protein [Cerasicoccus frondis]|uniref:hypothetical protein n=1 Tax=Cerasicoccus frondis TaxID=490090 RepID=UPI00285256E7|nr:hypothetical protein [Cerasicoccus frondis]